MAKLEQLVLPAPRALEALLVLAVLSEFLAKMDLTADLVP
jgi:hypothetical protein